MERFARGRAGLELAQHGERPLAHVLDGEAVLAQRDVAGRRSAETKVDDGDGFVREAVADRDCDCDSAGTTGCRGPLLAQVPQ